MKPEKTIILDSGKCRWGQCIFCSFGKKDAGLPDAGSLKRRIESCIAAEKKISVLKFFNSGSFLDDGQIPESVREYLIEQCIKKGVKNLIVECRPEFITDKSLTQLKSKSGRLRITFALGLEAADNGILRKIRKGMTVESYTATANRLKKHGFGVRTYLMANLPFVNDVKKSLEYSVRFSLKHSDSVAIINTFAYGYSELFRMWIEGKWHPLGKEEFEELVNKYSGNPKIDTYFSDYITYPRFPESMQEKLAGVGGKYLLHPHFNIWQDYISRFYEIPAGKKYALFLPCSFRKPYSLSRTHRSIIRRISSVRRYPELHQLMISNPGVIPREFEGKYPFAHYDWKEWLETPEIKKQYIEVTQKRIEGYLKEHKYRKIFAYFKPEAESFIALKRACSSLKLRLISCSDEKMFSRLAQEPGSAGIERDENILVNRKMLDHLADVLARELR